MADEPVEMIAIGDHAFADFLRSGKLMGTKCSGGNAIFVPAQNLCTHCQRSHMLWMRMEGTGRLLAFTCISIGPPWMVDQGYDRDHRYCTAVVELDEGPRVVARIDGVDAKRPENIRIGTRLAVQFGGQGQHQYSDTCLVFEPGD